jgi:hypothetical protein
LLRVEPLSFPGRDAEESGIELFGMINKTGPATASHTGHGRIRMVEGALAPPRLRDLIN